MVKNRKMVNIAGQFEAEALRVLREIPGLAVVPEPTGRDTGVDALLHFADQRAPIAVEFKRQANAATAWQLVSYAEANPSTPMLLVARETTAEAREILANHGIAVIDGLGNAHIELPGLLFHLEGRRRQRGAARPTRLSGKAGVAAQALLLQPDRTWTVQDLAERAEVAAGLAHRVLVRLEREGVITAEGAGPKRVRRLTNPTALLDLWAEEQVDRPARTFGYVLARTPQQLIKRLANGLGRAGIDYALTGAAGASAIAPFVTAIPVVDVWVTATATAEEFYDAVEADPMTEGQNVVFLQAKDNTPLAFRERMDGAWVANRFRLYADLRRDPRRGREQADHLRAEAIKF
jgi:hypothetical protein